MRKRTGNCEWIAYTDRFPRLRRWLHANFDYHARLSWWNKKVLRCSQRATHVGMSDHFAGYDNLPVCEKHFLDVKKSNRLDALIKSGELDRLLAEAKQRQDGKVPPE